MRRAAIPLPYVQNTPEWEEARRDSLGSSDIPIITGSAPPTYGSRFDLFALKTRRLDARPVDEMTQELFDMGHALEPVIATRYTAMTGRKVRRVRRMLRHPDIEWATCSLDRVCGRIIVEIKWDPWARFSKADEGVPPHVMEQVQWQMFVTGYEGSQVAVLKGSHIEVITVPADPDFQLDLLYLARRFREDHIVAGVPPEVDGSEATRSALTRLYPDEDGSMLEPSAELHALMASLAEAGPIAKTAEDEVKRLKNALRLALEDHAGAESDTWKVTYRKSKGRATTHWEELAAHYRSMVDAPADTLDEIERRHTETIEGSRRLLTTWKRPAGEDGSWT